MRIRVLGLLALIATLLVVALPATAQPVPARIVAVGDLHGDYDAWAAIARAAGLCERYQLRAYDALHLAAAEALMRIVSSKHMRWFGFDEMQNQAAVAIGLRDGMD